MCVAAFYRILQSFQKRFCNLRFLLKLAYISIVSCIMCCAYLTDYEILHHILIFKNLILLIRAITSLPSYFSTIYRMLNVYNNQSLCANYWSKTAEIPQRFSIKFDYITFSIFSKVILPVHYNIHVPYVKTELRQIFTHGAIQFNLVYLSWSENRNTSLTKKRCMCTVCTTM